MKNFKGFLLENMTIKQAFKVLGIDPGKPFNLKNIYKDMAKKFHPDKGGSTEKMQMINSAYSVLLKGGFDEFVDTKKSDNKNYFNVDAFKKYFESFTKIHLLYVEDVRENSWEHEFSTHDNDILFHMLFKIIGLKCKVDSFVFYINKIHKQLPITLSIDEITPQKIFNEHFLKSIFNN